MTPGRASSVLLCGLALAVLGSGILLAYARHEHQAQFRAMQQLIGERDELEVQWSALQLERATWTGYRRIGREAGERLSMRRPEKSDIVLLRLQPQRRQSAPGEER